MLRILFIAIIVRPFMALWVGMHVRGREHLPSRGPAIIAANHNSHLDTLALLSLFPLKEIDRVQAVAAADYFMKNPLMRFIAIRLIGILPITRDVAERDGDPLAAINAALDEGKILIFFPEGTRGDPEQMSRLKKGLARLAEARRSLPITPVYLQGFGKVMPRGSFLPVPFFCDVAIGRPLPKGVSRSALLQSFSDELARLSRGMYQATWD